MGLIEILLSKDLSSLILKHFTPNTCMNMRLLSKSFNDLVKKRMNFYWCEQYLMKKFLRPLPPKDNPLYNKKCQHLYWFISPDGTDW